MTTRRLKASSAALALSAVVALAGCGGGGDDRLTASTCKEQLRKIGKSFLTEVQREQRSFDAATTTSARTAGLVRFRGSFTNLADRVDAIKPPSRAQSTQDQLMGDAAQERDGHCSVRERSQGQGQRHGPIHRRGSAGGHREGHLGHQRPAVEARRAASGGADRARDVIPTLIADDHTLVRRVSADRSLPTGRRRSRLLWNFVTAVPV